MKIEWRHAAYRDVLNIVDYIDIENPAAAFAIYEEIHAQITMLGNHSNMGRPGRVH